MKRILTLAVTAILASVLAFAQESTTSTPAAGSDQHAASTATTKKAKKSSKKHSKKAKSTKTSATSTSESTPK